MLPKTDPYRFSMIFLLYKSFNMFREGREVQKVGKHSGKHRFSAFDLCSTVYNFVCSFLRVSNGICNVDIFSPCSLSRYIVHCLRLHRLLNQSARGPVRGLTGPKDGPCANELLKGWTSDCAQFKTFSEGVLFLDLQSLLIFGEFANRKSLNMKLLAGDLSLKRSHVSKIQ